MILAFVGQKGGIGKSTTAICLAARGLGVSSACSSSTPTARPGSNVERRSERERNRRADDRRDGGHDAPPRSARRHRARHDRRHRLPASPRRRAARSPHDPPTSILPCGPSAADAWALASSLELIAEARTLREELKRASSSRASRRTALGKGRRVLETSGLPRDEQQARFTDRVPEAIAVGRGVTSYAPKDRATHEVCSLFDENQEVFPWPRSKWVFRSASRRRRLISTRSWLRGLNPTCAISR